LVRRALGRPPNARRNDDQACECERPLHQHDCSRWILALTIQDRYAALV
jgi:hypothetical protein